MRRIGLAIVGCAVALAGCQLAYLSPTDYPTPQPTPVVWVNGAHEGPDNFHTMQVAMQSVPGWQQAEFHLPVLNVTPDRCMSDLSASLAVAVEEVLAQPGVTKVDLVGYSLGGPLLRDYLVHYARPGTVEDAVLLASPNEGTDFGASPTSTDCWEHDLRSTSAFIAALNATPVPAGIRVTNVYAPGDVFIAKGPPLVAYDPVINDPNVNNVAIPLDDSPLIRHIVISMDDRAIEAIARGVYNPEGMLVVT